MKALCFLSIILLFIAQHCKGLVPEDGVCTLFVYAPFTYDGSDMSFTFNGINTSWGLLHMASALIAVEHFNKRDASIFKELENFRDCPIELEPRFFDSRVVGHGAAQSFAQHGIIPCAIAGPFSDQPALELSALALAHEFPLVAYRAFNDRVSLNSVNPYTSQVFPDLTATSEALVSFLLFANRTNYISFVYPATDAGSQRREAFTYTLDKNEIRWYAVPYQVAGSDNDEQALRRTMKETLQKVKNQGYRTIVVSMDDPVRSHLEPLSVVAEELGMTNGDYFWIWMGTTDVFDHQSQTASMNTLMDGSVWVTSGENYFIEPEGDPFLNAWYQQYNTNMADRMNEANPLAEGDQGYIFATPDTFSNLSFPDWGCGLLADAVISIGIGACLAREENTNSSAEISGYEHLQHIRKVSFRGASAEVVRFSSGSEERPGTRDPTTVKWAAMNFQQIQPKVFLNRFAPELTPEMAPELMMLPIGAREGLGHWKLFQPVIYANGTTSPPDLRDLPNQNYLSPPLQAFGLALMALAILLGIVTIIWVYINRKHSVLVAAQPYFLYLIALGSILFSLSIFTISFDESYGWTEDQLTSACIAQPWFIAVGHVVIYGALYSKLWRVNRALQFARRRVGFYRAVLPFGILLALTVLSLSLTTSLGPAEWERDVVDNDTGESMGRCSEGHDGIVFLVMVIITIMAACFAWRTRDVDSAYSESWWILMLILLQFEVYIVAAPVLVILEDVSTNGFYFGNVILAWIFPMSTLLLIMLPKVAAHHKAEHHVSHRVRGSGGHGGTRVSGIGNMPDTCSMPRSTGTPRSSDTTARPSMQVVELTGPALQEVLEEQRRASPPENAS